MTHRSVWTLPRIVYPFCVCSHSINQLKNVPEVRRPSPTQPWLKQNNIAEYPFLVSRLGYIDN